MRARNPKTVLSLQLGDKTFFEFDEYMLRGVMDLLRELAPRWRNEVMIARFVRLRPLRLTPYYVLGGTGLQSNRCGKAGQMRARNSACCRTRSERSWK